MTRRPNRNRTARPVAPVVGRPVVDSFQNVEAKLGIGADNQSTSASYAFNFITRSRQQLEAMYRGSWLVGQAVDCPAEDMTRAGIDIRCEADPTVVDAMSKEIERLQIWESLTNLMRWDRLYGGAVGIIMIEGQGFDKPLRAETVAKGQFAGIYVLDRWTVQPLFDKLVSKYGPDLGKPEFYRVLDASPALGGETVHYSRVIRTEGIPLPYWQKIAELGWGLSVLERLYDRLVAFDSTTTGAAQLVYKAHLRTISVAGLRQILAAGGATEAALIKQVEYIRRFQTNEGLTLIDAEDKFETTSYTFSGLSDVLLQFAQQLSGALQIPLVRLFGQSPAGLNATGESDIRNYYDLIKQQQETKLRSPVSRILPLVYRNIMSDDAPMMSFEFNSLWQMSENDRASVTGAITTAIVNAYDSGIVSKPVAMKELREASEVTGVWSNITDEEIEEAEAEPPPTPEMGDPDGEPQTQVEQFSAPTIVPDQP